MHRQYLTKYECRQMLRDKFIPMLERVPSHMHVTPVIAIRCDDNQPAIDVPFYVYGNINNYNRIYDSDKMQQVCYSIPPYFITLCLHLSELDQGIREGSKASS